MESNEQSSLPMVAEGLGDLTSQLLNAVSPALDVDSICHPKPDPRSFWPFRQTATLEIRGRLRLPSEQAYALISERFRSLGHLALLRRAGDEDIVLAVPGKMSSAAGRPWVAIVLFIATVFSVLLTGASQDPFASGPLAILSGWQFAVSLLSILLAHEFGHYLVSRHFGTPVSLPYFIPLPFSLLGTMGAVIRMRGLPRDRRTLFAVAIAGPLAGFIVAVPVLILGLHLSTVGSMPPGGQVLQEGNSILYALLKLMTFGRFLPSGGEDVILHPVALAGWAGLLVTSMNLIPAAQLDGGHIAHALLGDRARLVTWIVVAILLALGVLWFGWFLWAALVFVFGRMPVILLDGITNLNYRERWLAALILVIFVLVFVPIPMVVR